MDNTEIAQKLLQIAGNPLEFLEYVYIRDPLRGRIKFEQWNHLLDALTVFLAFPLVIILKARQIGVSWLLAAYAVWTILTKPLANVLLISKGEREAGELLSKCKFIYQNLPDYLQQSLSYDSASCIGLSKMESKITALPCTGTAGIGEAATLVICDEWDKWDVEIQESNFASLKPTIDAGGQFIGVSTVDKYKVDSLFKQIFREALAGHNNFKGLFYPWNIRPGRDSNWYKKQELDYPDYLLKQEYPSTVEEALSPLTGKSIFRPEALERLLNNTIAPTEIRRGYVHIIHPPEVGVRYVGAVDVGEGVGLDYSVYNIVGTKGMQSEVCAVIYSNEIKTDLFAYEIYRLWEEYYKHLLAVENNSLGIAVLNKLVELGCSNLYKTKEKLGWTTTAQTRETGLVELSQDIDNGSLITRFRPQVLELMNFYFKDGRPQAARGGHDDLVMSLMIANQIITPYSSGVLPTIRLVGKQAKKAFVRT